MGINLKVERMKPEKGYTVIHNHILNDTNLTFKAKGILVLLLSMPPNPRNLSIEQIARKHKDGVSAVRSGIEELKDAGYLEVHQINNALGQYDGVLWCLRDTARVAEMTRNTQETPDAENPNSDRPPSEKRGHINTYKTKKPKSKRTTTPTEQSGCTVEDLRFTATMLAETQVLVRKALEQVAPDERQRMLDDFCAAVRSGEIKKSQLGWLHAVISRYKNGEYNFRPMQPKPVSAIDGAHTSYAAVNPALTGPSSVKPPGQSSVALEALSKLKKNRCKPIS